MNDLQAADSDQAVADARETDPGLRTTETAPLPNFEVGDVATEIISAVEYYEDGPSRGRRRGGFSNHRQTQYERPNAGGLENTQLQDDEAAVILALRESRRPDANAKVL